MKNEANMAYEKPRLIVLNEKIRNCQGFTLCESGSGADGCGAGLTGDAPPTGE